MISRIIKNPNKYMFFVGLLTPFALSYIIPMLYFNYFSHFNIGKVDEILDFKDLITVIPYLLIISLIYLYFFYKYIFKKTYQKENLSFSYLQLTFFIVLGFIGAAHTLIDYLNIHNFLKQIFLQLSFFPLIIVIYLSNVTSINRYKKTKFTLLFLLISQCLFDFILTSITRDLLTKLLIFICLYNFKNLNKKIFLIFILFLTVLFLGKDYLRKNYESFYFKKDVSIDDFKLEAKEALYLNSIINIDDPNIKGYQLIELTKDYKIYDAYEKYFQNLNIETINDSSDERSLCDRKDQGCLTFKDFYKRLISISISKIDDNKKPEINILKRFNKISNLAYYEKVMDSELEFLKFKLYYPQIYTIIPIPRQLWKNKPVNENGNIIGDYFSFNSVKSGSIGWYEPLLIELFMSFGGIGYFFYLIINTYVLKSLLVLRFYKKKNTFSHSIITLGLLKFYFDYHVQGLIGSLGGMVYFYFVCLGISYFMRNWLRG